MGLTTKIHTNYFRHTFIKEFFGGKIDNNNNTERDREGKNKQNMLNNFKRFGAGESERVGARQLHLISFQKWCLLGLYAEHTRACHEYHVRLDNE